MFLACKSMYRRWFSFLLSRRKTIRHKETKTILGGFFYSEMGLCIKSHWFSLKFDMHTAFISSLPLFLWLFWKIYLSQILYVYVQNPTNWMETVSSSSNLNYTEFTAVFMNKVLDRLVPHFCFLANSKIWNNSPVSNLISNRSLCIENHVISRVLLLLVRY